MRIEINGYDDKKENRLSEIKTQYNQVQDEIGALDSEIQFLHKVNQELQLAFQNDDSKQSKAMKWFNRILYAVSVMMGTCGLYIIYVLFVPYTDELKMILMFLLCYIMALLIIARSYFKTKLDESKKEIYEVAEIDRNHLIIAQLSKAIEEKKSIFDKSLKDSLQWEIFKINEAENLENYKQMIAQIPEVNCWRIKILKSISKNEYGNIVNSEWKERFVWVSDNSFHYANTELFFKAHYFDLVTIHKDQVYDINIISESLDRTEKKYIKLAYKLEQAKELQILYFQYSQIETFIMIFNQMGIEVKESELKGLNTLKKDSNSTHLVNSQVTKKIEKKIELEEEIYNKLIILKRLYNESRITQEDFQKKQQELLDSLL